MCSDTADFTSPPPYLGQDCMQWRVIDIDCQKKIRKIPIPEFSFKIWGGGQSAFMVLKSGNIKALQGLCS